MGNLLANGSRLYRYGGQLLRTPIKITLDCDDQCRYAVGGNYSSSSGDPTSGYYSGVGASTLKETGERMIDNYMHPTKPLQIWKQYAGDPMAGSQGGFVWYQGRFRPSGADPGLQWQSGEAYLQLCGYHFTLPQSLHGLEVTGVNIKFHAGGALRTNGDPADAANAVYPLYGLTGERGIVGQQFQTTNYYPYTDSQGTHRVRPTYSITDEFDYAFPVRFCSAVNRPADDRTYDELCAMDYDEVDLSEITRDEIAGGAGVHGWRQLWFNGIGGRYPILQNAGSKFQHLSAPNCVAALRNNGAAWFFAYLPVAEITKPITKDILIDDDGRIPLRLVSSTEFNGKFFAQTYPQYLGAAPSSDATPPNTTVTGGYRWATASLWGFQLEVELG